MATINGRFNGLAQLYGFDDGLADNLSGTSGGDRMNGYGGADVIYGYGGTDVIDGGMGDDWIVGGTSYDDLTGGAGRDTFMFARGDSGPTYAGADIIRDFNSVADTILFSGNSPAGNSSNYVEKALGGMFGLAGFGNAAQDYAEALDQARLDIHGNVQFAFYTNGTDGYLFADVDHNGFIDTSIELKGLDSLSDFSSLDIH